MSAAEGGEGAARPRDEGTDRGARGGLPEAAAVGHGFVEGVGGVRLFRRSWEVDRARGRVLVVHGLGEHSGRYRRVAAALVRAGFSVFAADLRGHGWSRGRRGHVRSFDRLVRDVDRLRRRTAGAGGDDPPLFLLGHSLGGLVVLRYLQEFAVPSVAGGVCAAPFVRLAAPVPGWKLRMGEIADRFAPGLTLDNELDRDLLLRDPDERQLYRSDPLVHDRISARMWGEMLREADAVVEMLDRLLHPVLLQVPGGDRVVDPDATLELAGRRAGLVEAVRYPEAYHDLYHDPAAGRALEDLVDWLDRRAGRPEG